MSLASRRERRRVIALMLTYRVCLDVSVARSRSLLNATLKEIMKATNWQPHSVRGFLSGTIGKKMGLTVKSTKGEDGERSYSLKG